MEHYLQLINDNLDTIVMVVGVVIAILRLTAWGKANKAALDAVTDAIEKTDAKEVKEKIKTIHDSLPAGASNALQDSVRTADDKKKTPTAVETLAEIAMVRPRQKP